MWSDWFFASLLHWLLPLPSQWSAFPYLEQPGIWREKTGAFLPCIIRILIFDLLKSYEMFFYRTIVLLILFSQYLRNFKIPFPYYRSSCQLRSRRREQPADAGSGCGIKRFDIFSLLPVMTWISASLKKDFIFSNLESWCNCDIFTLKKRFFWVSSSCGA